MVSKRRFLALAATALAGAGVVRVFGSGTSPATAKEAFEITKTPEEWRAVLTDAQYRVLREEATERAFTSPQLEEKREGNYTCAGCELPLYASSTKFDSRTGWPSFYEALPGAVGTKTDFKLVYPRTEVHCSQCGGHLGHIFNDGPPPTGKRHCINGVAMGFVPKMVS